VWLLIGGVFYTIGAVIYALKRPNPIPGRFGFHEIFHLFVLAGSRQPFLVDVPGIYCGLTERTN